MNKELLQSLVNSREFRIAFVALTIANVVLWYQLFFIPVTTSPQYYFLNIGQGDSELILLPDGSGGNIKLLIDGGKGGRILEELGKVLPNNDRYIDLILMTHPQLDHFGGFVDVIKQYAVGMLINTGRTQENTSFQALQKIIADKHVQETQLKSGDRITYRGITMDVLNPSSATINSKELNDTCIVLLVNDGKMKSLFTGDAGANVEGLLIKKYNLDVDILKVGHHGSRFATSIDFLRATTPTIAVIEVGKNTYGHPTKQTIERLEMGGTKIYRTDQNGTIKIQEVEGNLRVSAQK